MPSLGHRRGDLPMPREIRLWQGTVIFGADEPRKDLWFLTSGSVRFHGGAGEEMLCHAQGGACLLTSGDSASEAVAATDITAICVPCANFARLVSASQEFRAFVFAACSQRIAELFSGSDEMRRGHLPRLH